MNWVGFFDSGSRGLFRASLCEETPWQRDKRVFGLTVALTIKWLSAFMLMMLLGFTASLSSESSGVHDP